MRGGAVNDDGVEILGHLGQFDVQDLLGQANDREVQRPALFLAFGLSVEAAALGIRID
jgi:hypothetical protein